jgi:V8-like Glu-specific endopeptidase
MGMRLRRGPARLSWVAVATALTVTAYATVADGTARAAAGPSGAPATQAVVHPVARAAQASARSFWTAARMKSATPVGSAAPASTPQPPPGIPDPTYFSGVRTVGALFFTTGTQAHFCTASVVDSTALDLVLTAAHCVYGSTYATNIAYVPEWHQGVSPYGAWAVQDITVAAGWKQSQDPDLDFAFLAVAPPPGTARPIQLVTGGLLLGVNAGYAHPITVIGYNNTDDEPINCATTSFKFETTQMEFYCNNFQDGTSGGPWILHFDPVTGGGIVVGDIGGYEQGGDYPWASYSPYYSASILKLFLQAQRAQA